MMRNHISLARVHTRCVVMAAATLCAASALGYDVNKDLRNLGPAAERHHGHTVGP